MLDQSLAAAVSITQLGLATRSHRAKTMTVLWRKDTGEAVFFQFPIDAADAIKGGYFTSEEPANASDDDVEHDDKKTQEIGERDRLGQPLTKEERAYIAPIQAQADDVSPLGPQAVSAVEAPPEPTEKTPFDPVKASREDIIAWLVNRGETVRATTSTLTLRDRAANLLKG